MKRKKIIQSTLGLHQILKADYGFVGFEKVDMNQHYLMLRKANNNLSWEVK